MSRKDEMIFKAILGKLLTFLIGVVFVVFILEVMLRITGYVTMSTQGSRNRVSFVTAGAYRIMCIGESTTADLGGRSASFPRQLGKILNNRGGGKGFSIINKGVPGVDTDFLIAELESNLDIYRPDMVVAMMGLNDSRTSFSSGGTAGKERFSLVNLSKIYKLMRFLYFDLVQKKKIDSILDQPAYYKGGGGPFMEDTEKMSGKPEKKENALWFTGVRYAEEGELDKARDIFEECIKKWQGGVWTYLKLGERYYSLGEADKGEKVYRRVINGEVYGKAAEKENGEQEIREGQRLGALISLGGEYVKQKRYDDAEELFKEVVAIKPDLGYGNMAALYEKKGDLETAREYRLKSAENNPQVSNPVTRSNYNRLKEILDSRGVRLACVQYPLRDVKLLKNAFDDPSGVIFVDNEKIFRDALKKVTYEDLFYDRCYCDFGHGTDKGNRLLAESVAKVILEALEAEKKEGQALK